MNAVLVGIIFIIGFFIIILGILAIDLFLVSYDVMECENCGSVDFERVDSDPFNFKCSSCSTILKSKEVLIGDSERDNSCS